MATSLGLVELLSIKTTFIIYSIVKGIYRLAGWSFGGAALA